MGHITGDLVANFRSTIRYTLRDLGLVWMKPNIGKWALEAARGRSIVDYIMANPSARKLVKKSEIWMNAIVAGLDHRVISCDVEYAVAPILAELKSHQQGGRSEYIVRCIRKTDLVNKSTHKAVEQEFRKGYSKVRDAVDMILRPLMYPEHSIKQSECQAIVDEAHTRIMEYIKGSLERAGLQEYTHKRASSKPFRDSRLSLLERQRDSLWKMDRGQVWLSPEMAYTAQKAKLVDRTLKKEVRCRKRNGSLNFVGEVDRLPYNDLLGLMNSMRRRK